jgi:haloalkane dehalogenase
MEILRTPKHRFANLLDYPFSPHYVELESLRIHYVDEGENAEEVVLMMHGEPSWSYLYRHMIPPIVAAGYRAVAPDLVGFGRSDKPSQQSDYTYQNHVEWMSAWLQALDLKNITLFCQDWGGLIGLRLVAAFPERFKRVVAANTFLPVGKGKPSPAFLAWQQFSQTTPVFKVGKIVNGGTFRQLSEAEMDAYDAPFPDESYKAGARIFPALVPTVPEQAGAAENLKAWEVLSQWEKPFLTTFSDKDPITAGADQALQARIPGAQGQPHTIIEDGGHFLQEDQGPEIAEKIISFIRANP